MKFLVLMLALVTLSAHAQPERTLKKTLMTHSCVMKIVNQPVIFAKEKNRTLSGNLIFAALEWSSSLRRLKVNRTIDIHAVTAKHILMDDQSIASVCVLNRATRKCDTNMENLTISEIERESGKNIRITCRKDSITDI